MSGIAATPPIPPTTIDLNCDMGEGESPAHHDADRALMAFITSANIACGGHAGSDATMERTIRDALEHSVAIGAHPGYPDRAGFGRTTIPMPAHELEASINSQLGTLERIARAAGTRIAHVKPHGALYHDAMHDAGLAALLGRCAARLDRPAVMIALAGAPALARWRELGLPVAAEAFADRRYHADGTLRPRTLADALIVDPLEAAAQAVAIACRGEARAHDGTTIRLHAHTLCLHSDTPGALASAAVVRRALRDAGVHVRALDATDTQPKA